MAEIPITVNQLGHLRGAAVAIAFRAGYWNIGVEGQLLMGAIAAAGIGQVVDGFDTTVAAMAAAGTPGDGVPSEPIQIQSIRIVET